MLLSYYKAKERTARPEYDGGAAQGRIENEWCAAYSAPCDGFVFEKDHLHVTS